MKHFAYDEINPETYEFKLINEEELQRFMDFRYCATCPMVGLEADLHLYDCGYTFFDPQCYHHYEAVADWMNAVLIDAELAARIGDRA